MNEPAPHDRTVAHYAARGQRVLDAAHALGALRAFLSTGTPSGVTFPRGVRFEDAAAGLPLLSSD